MFTSFAVLIILKTSLSLLATSSCRIILKPMFLSISNLSARRNSLQKKLFSPNFEESINCLSASETIGLEVTNKSYASNKDLSDDNETSVHLKLTKLYDHQAESSKNESVANQTTLVEYVYASNGSVIIACLGTNVTELELFGRLKFEQNLTNTNNILIRTVKFPCSIKNL